MSTAKEQSRPVVAMEQTINSGVEILFQLSAWDLTRVSSRTVDVVAGGSHVTTDRRRGP